MAGEYRQPRPRRPIPIAAEPHDIAFRIEPIVDLRLSQPVGCEWLLDHAHPSSREGWTPVYQAMVHYLPQTTRKIAINITSCLLQNLPTRALLRSIAVTHGPRIIFEWVEDANGDHQATAQTLKRWRTRYGIGIAIDDVGSSGLDGLWRILHTAPDWIKLDGALFQASLKDALARSILTHIVQIAEAQGSHLIVEWIETAEHHQWAMQYGAQFGQGFLFNREGGF